MPDQRITAEHLIYIQVILLKLILLIVDFYWQ